MDEAIKMKCRKCGKEKPLSQMVEIEGEKYCCNICCGDTAKGEHKQTKELACEFC